MRETKSIKLAAIWIHLEYLILATGVHLPKSTSGLYKPTSETHRNTWLPKQRLPWRPGAVHGFVVALAVSHMMVWTVNCYDLTMDLTMLWLTCYVNHIVLWPMGLNHFVGSFLRRSGNYHWKNYGDFWRILNANKAFALTFVGLPSATTILKCVVLFLWIGL